MVQGAILRHDVETYRAGIHEILTKARQLISRYKPVPPKPLSRRHWDHMITYRQTAEYTYHHLVHFAQLLIRSDQHAVRYLIESIRDLAELASKHRVASERAAIISIYEIGMLSVKNQLWNAARASIEAISSIAVGAPYEDYLTIYPRRSHNGAIGDAIEAIYEISTQMFNEKPLEMLQVVTRNVRRIGVLTASRELLWQTCFCIHLLQKVTAAFMRRERSFPLYESIAGDAVKAIDEIARVSAQNGLMDGYERAVVAFWDIGVQALYSDYLEVARQSVKHLADALASHKQIFESAKKTVSESPFYYGGTTEAKQMFQLFQEFFQIESGLLDSNGTKR